jgi:hypothetical protein
MVVPKIHRHGAEAARGAHNPEVTGSKPVAGILFVPEKKWSYPATVRILTLTGSRALTYSHCNAPVGCNISPPEARDPTAKSSGE